MIKRTLTAFGAKGRLVLDTANGRQTLDYWYYTPFFWRVEQDGALVLDRKLRTRIPTRSAGVRSTLAVTA